MSGEPEGINLTIDEAVCMARRIVARAVADTEGWLEWEDYPNLGEHAFARLQMAVEEHGVSLGVTADIHDRLANIDSRYLIEETQK